MAETNKTGIDPKIAHPLGRVRGIIRRYVTIEGVLGVLLFAAVWFWTAMLLDYGIFKLLTFDWALEAPKGFRIVALIVAVSLIVAYMVTRLFIRLTREFSDSSVALVLEKRFPKELGDRLITAVELSDLDQARQYGYSVDMIKKTVEDVRNRIDDIPVSHVFNWRRLRRMAVILVALTVGLTAVSGAAVCAVTKTSPMKFVREFSDVSTTLAERDLFLMNTPWPRRAYLEVVNFEGQELRVGRDVPSPRIRVAAYEYVIADRSAAAGWRPLTWADLNNVLPGEKIPSLPVEPIRAIKSGVEIGPFVFGSAHPFTAPTLPADVADAPTDPARWPVDRVRQVFVESDEIRGLLGDGMANIRADIERVINVSLSEKASNPSNARTLRKLKIPDEVELKYWGLKTRVDMKLRPEANNEFTGMMSDLKESVRFHTRGEDYYTPTKVITLVPPPALVEFTRTELQPAYLHHKAPFADAKELDDAQKPYLADPTKLKGLRHTFKDQAITLTGDKSRFDIPIGTEVTIHGKSDKALKQVQIRPKAGKFPGHDVVGTGEPEPIEVPVTEGRSFSFAFDRAHNTLVTRQTEFDLFLRDTDGVTSSRPVQIVVDEDRPPDVDVVVDVIRKVGNVYWCTPQALIPFTKESKIRDDKGLNRVDFLFNYYEIEPPAVTGKRGEFAAWLWSSAPLMPSMADGIYRAATLLGVYKELKPAQSVVDGRSAVPGFVDEYRKRQQTLDQIKALLNGPKPTGAEQTVISTIDFKLAGVEAEEGFDLRKVAPGLKRENENVVQRNYVVTLGISAVDTNVESDRPGIGTNKETLIFRVVSEGELLNEIAQEEKKIADKFEEAVRKISEMDQKFNSLAARVPNLVTPEAFIADLTRSNDLLEVLAKGRDISAEVNADYSRILLEFRANRLPDHLITQLESRVTRKLQELVTQDFPQLDEAYGQFHNALNNNRQPTAEQVSNARAKLTLLLNKMREIANGIGQGLDLKAAIRQAEEIIKKLSETQDILAAESERVGHLVDKVNVRMPTAPINIPAGGKVSVRLPLRVGPAYFGNYTMVLGPSPNSELQVAPSVKFKQEDTELLIEITAGYKQGQHWVRLTPDLGQERDLRIIVGPARSK